MATSLIKKIKNICKLISVYKKSMRQQCYTLIICGLNKHFSDEFVV